MLTMNPADYTSSEIVVSNPVGPNPFIGIPPLPTGGEQPQRSVSITSTYDPVPHSWANYFVTSRRHPLFSLASVPLMLTDPRIQFGLHLIKGPMLSQCKFFCKVAEDDPQETPLFAQGLESGQAQQPGQQMGMGQAPPESPLKKFLVRNVTRFWRSSAIRALKAVEWGFSCSEALYKLGDDGIVEFDTLKDLNSLDCRALTRSSKLVGAVVIRNIRDKAPNSRVILPLPRVLWHVHARHLNPWYGQSRLYGSWRPWIEIWDEGGFRDSRRLFFYKYAYDGGTYYYPPGISRMGEDVNGQAIIKTNKDLVREIADKKRAGGATFLPNDQENGVRRWEHIPPDSVNPPAGLDAYGADLRNELWEGMGIPPEIAHADEAGGYAGRRVPMVAFYSTLQELVSNLIGDYDAQILNPLVRYNFGDHAANSYEILPFGLMEQGEGENGIDQDSTGPDQTDENPMMAGLSGKGTFGQSGQGQPGGAPLMARGNTK